MNQPSDPFANALFGEILAVDHLARSAVSKALPKGMELSHFLVLNHLIHVSAERSPGELAQALHLTRGAMTNTLAKLEWAGHIHVRPDWDDARRKKVAISPAGRAARDAAFAAMSPVLTETVKTLGEPEIRAALSVLRGLRSRLAAVSEPPSRS